MQKNVQKNTADGKYDLRRLYVVVNCRDYGGNMVHKVKMALAIRAGTSLKG